VADPEPPDDGIPGVEPGREAHWETARRDLQERIDMLEKARAGHGLAWDWYDPKAVGKKINNLEQCITHIFVSLQMIDVMMGHLKTPYDWETWAKDTDPESGKAAADLAASVGVGLDRLLGKWKG